MANVKNFGLKGVASDVQLGKNGGRLVFNPTAGGGGGNTIQIVDSGGASISVQGAAGILDTEFVTVAQLNGVSSGITPKASARVRTTTDIDAGAATWASGGGAGGTGQFTGAPSTVDGITLNQNDRILVGLEGVTFLPNGNVDTITEADTVRNGIYVVGVTTTTWDRAADHDEDIEVRYGDYVFITEGTVGEGKSYVMTNFFNNPLVDGNEPTLNTDGVVFILFGAAPTFEAEANGGLELVNGDEFRLDIDNLITGTTSLTSTLAYGDGSAGGKDNRQTLQGIFNTHNVVYGVADFATSGDGYVVRTAEDTYKITNFVADTTQEGIAIAEDFAGTGTTTWGLDIGGITDNRAGSTATTDILVLETGVAGGNSQLTVGSFVNDLDIVRSNGIANGILTKTANDVYVGRAIVVNTGLQAGLSIANGNGVSGNPSLGLNITGLAAKASTVVADELVITDSVDSTNKKITMQRVVDLVGSITSSNIITQGDSNVTVTDAGTGSVVTTVDGNATLTVTDGAVSAETLVGENLTITRVLFAGVSGLITDDAGMTYAAAGNNLTVGGDVGAATLTASGVVSGASGNFGTGTVTGGAGTFSGVVSGLGLSAGASGTTDSSLTAGGAVVFTSGSSRLIDDGTAFSYNTSTNTLTVENLNVTGSGGISINANEIAYGDTGGGNVTGSTKFTLNATTGVVSIEGLDIQGTGGNQNITGTEVNGDISIIPNGTGEVVIGSSATGIISSDPTQSLTIDGKASLNLQSGTGSVFIKDNSLNVAQFTSNASADTHITFTSDTVANGPRFGPSGSADLKVLLSTGKLLKAVNAADYLSTLQGAGNTDAFTTKAYVTDAIQSGASAESTKTATVNVSLASNGTTAINVSGGTTIPANAIVLSAKVLVNTLDATATLEIGDGTTANRYVTSSENDPGATGIYVIESYDADASAIQLEATVASTNADAGANADVIVEYRVPS